MIPIFSAVSGRGLALFVLALSGWWTMGAAEAPDIGVGKGTFREYFPPPDREGGWRNAADASQIRKRAGMDFGKLNQAWEFTQRCTQNGGLLVVRNGWLVFEKYFWPSEPKLQSGHGLHRQGIHEHRLRNNDEGVPRPYPRWPGYEGVHAEVSAGGFLCGWPAR